VSDWKKINHGVPQGSILGPLLFLEYINDLPLYLNRISTPIQFADDTSVLITSQNPRDFNIITNEILKKLDKWFKTNLLSLNYTVIYIHYVTFTLYNKTVYSISLLSSGTLSSSGCVCWLSTLLSPLIFSLSFLCFFLKGWATKLELVDG
jgi:hypothetical protein